VRETGIALCRDIRANLGLATSEFAGFGTLRPKQFNDRVPFSARIEMHGHGEQKKNKSDRHQSGRPIRKGQFNH
jgi:hypothetical protein